MMERIQRRPRSPVDDTSGHQALGHGIVNDVLDRKLASAQSKWTLPQMLLNGCLAAFFYYDSYFGLLVGSSSDHVSVFQILEVSFAILLTLNTGFLVYKYLSPTYGQEPIMLSPQQMRLFGVKENDPGFRPYDPLMTPKSGGTSFISCTPTTQSLLLPSPDASGFASTSPSMLSSMSLDSSALSWGMTPNFTPSPNMSISSSSWVYQPGQASHWQNGSALHSPLQNLNDSDSAGIRRRLMSSPICSGSPSSAVMNEKSIDQYLKEFDDMQQRSQKMIPDHSGDESSFWSFACMKPDFTPLLRKYQYQPATKSPQSSAMLKDNPDSPATLSGDGIWLQLKISDNELNIWIENLRKWLSQTILTRLINEIDNINDLLRRMGSADLQIGDVSQSTLRQVVLTKGQHIPTLNALLPYLDVSLNQEYLINRLRELAKGGCMSEFRWNSGGSYKGKPWMDDLPTDCAIIMHGLCTYLDSRLPPHPHYPDGKTFTSQYFKKTPDKPSFSKEALCIYQSRIHPPHYRLIIGQDTWDLPKGRNNMFYVILLFLHHIKTKQAGMLGRVNFGPSGVNVLWVVDT